MSDASDLVYYSIALPTPLTTTVLVSGVTSDTISATYSTLLGNQPSTYGNTAFLWQSSNAIPYNQKPLATYSIPGGTQDGSFSFSGLTIQSKSYIVGYAVGPDINQICATCYIPASGSDFQAFQTTLDVSNVSTDSATVNYQTPAGYSPQTNANYIGLWEGSVASYTISPLITRPITTNTSTGSVIINDFQFKRSKTYILAYFMGTKQTMMAATYTFST
jgi:hypothetical protein